ncbi:hypothetical protein [Synechococcus sp. UW140]|uniref:hypothetical protein n=1 Tax=Synechococcus sp. UW140 TaxID=368503 RepID=UPI003137F630
MNPSEIIKIINLSKRKSYLQQSLFIILVLFLFYSFGPFGFWNLFGIRLVVQGILVCFSFYLVGSYQFSLLSKYCLPVSLFLALLAIGGFIQTGSLSYVIEASLLATFLIFLFSAPPRYIINLAKALVISTFCLSFLVLVAFFIYFLNPDLISQANFNIYDSTSGANQIYPSSFVDWISFTSGDGYVFLGNNLLRLKGFSSEPSATIVYYLAPAALSFLLKGPFPFFGFFILLFNIISISSFTSIIIISLSLILLSALSIFKKRGYFALALFFIFLIFILFNINLLNSIFASFSSHAVSSFDYDLVSRKMGEGNLGARQGGITSSAKMILESPLGFPTTNLGAGSGMIFTVSSITGILGLSLYLMFIRNLIRAPLILLNYNDNFFDRCFVSFFFSLLYVAMFVSGYGWDRFSGIALLFLILRLLNVRISLHSPPT